MNLDYERIWNLIIQWCLRRIHRAGGVHQDTFYDILEKCRKDTIKAQIKLFEKDYHGEGWDD